MERRIRIYDSKQGKYISLGGGLFSDLSKKLLKKGAESLITKGAEKAGKEAIKAIIPTKTKKDEKIIDINQEKWVKVKDIPEKSIGKNPAEMKEMTGDEIMKLFSKSKKGLPKTEKTKKETPSRKEINLRLNRIINMRRFLKNILKMEEIINFRSLVLVKRYEDVVFELETSVNPNVANTETHKKMVIDL